MAQNEVEGRRQCRKILRDGVWKDEELDETDGRQKQWGMRMGIRIACSP